MLRLLFFYLLSLMLITKMYGQAGTGVTSYTVCSSGLVRQLHIDAQENIWLATSTEGLKKFKNGVILNTYNTSNSAILSNNLTYVYCYNSKVAIGSNFGFSIFDGTTFTNYSTTNSALPNDTIKEFCNVGNTLFIATKAGLSIFDGNSFTNYNTSNSILTTKIINEMSKDNGNTVYLATAKGLFSYNNSTNSFTNHTLSNTPFPRTSAIKRIYVDDNNYVWLDGANRFDGTSYTNLKWIYPQYEFPPATAPIYKGINGGIGIGNEEYLPDNSKLKFSGSLLMYSVPTYRYVVQSSNLHIWSSVTNTLRDFNPTAINYNPIVTPRTDFNILNVNNAQVRLNSSGSLFAANPYYHSDYLIPSNSECNPVYFATPWMAGLDSANSLHQFGFSVYYDNSLLAGPIDTITGCADIVNNDYYKRVWRTDRLKIEEFKYYFQNGSVQNGTYTPDTDIIEWPASGIANYSRQLAPFVDVNGDGLYRPLIDGDYPLIKGDQMCYWIVNDKPNNTFVNAYNGVPFGVEIHISAYAYTCPSITDSLQVLNNTTFYEYKVINRSNQNYHDVYFGNLHFFDYSAFNQAYIGCYPPYNYGFAYISPDTLTYPFSNSTCSKFPPMNAIVVLDGPLAQANDSIDNNNNGVIDELGEKNLMPIFRTYYYTQSPKISTPQYASTFYRYLKGLWADTSPITVGNNGYTGTVPTKLIFDGEPGGAGWTEMSVPGNQPVAWKLFLQSCGPLNIAVGETIQYSFANVFTQDVTAPYNLNSLYHKNRDDVRRITDWYNQNTAPSCFDVNVNVGYEANNERSKLTIYPNPFKGSFTVQLLGNEPIMEIKIYNVLGERVSSKLINQNIKEVIVNMNDLPQGVYIVEAKTINQYLHKKIVKQ